MYSWISWELIVEPLRSAERNFKTTAPDHSGVVVVSLTMITHLHKAIVFTVYKTHTLKILLFLLVLPAATACTY